ncbi:hypothetical protein ACOMHN_053409 [Nucella lapillus]
MQQSKNHRDRANVHRLPVMPAAGVWSVHTMPWHRAPCPHNALVPCPMTSVTLAPCPMSTQCPDTVPHVHTMPWHRAPCPHNALAPCPMSTVTLTVRHTPFTLLSLTP